MPTQYPIEYELKPKTISMGSRWLTLTIKNIGDENLIGLDVKLNSLDAYSISVYDTGRYVTSLKPGEESTVPFQVLVNSTDFCYVSIDGMQETKVLHWESPRIRLALGESKATLVSLFALTKPYPPRGERIQVEATLQGTEGSDDLRLEFWTQTPGEEFKELGTVQPKDLAEKERARYTVEFVPEEEGMYIVYAYLYDGAKRIGHELEQVYVGETSNEERDV
ncbi:MAG: hypothetical protein JXA89_12460 [Anaerolineae bacterium]|nr:hypothetical protein [Anaerolineae bacterium]